MKLNLLLICTFVCVSWASFSQEIDTTLVTLEDNLKMATTDSLGVEALLSLRVYQLRRDFNLLGFNSPRLASCEEESLKTLGFH